MIPARMLLTLWTLNLHSVSAWIPVGAPRVARVTGPRACTHRQQRSMCLSAVAMEGGSDGGRQDLVAMKKAFEGSMDNKLIMEYVMELRARKSLLLSSLEETGGVITNDIYSVMEELALVNPSSGCGAGSDMGKSHYCAMLPGHWIAASTIVPNVPFVFGDGEKGKKGSKAAPTSPSSGDGPTCTLGELISAISGRSGGGSGTAALEYNADIPVRPLRARISALTNTVKDGEMPTVVAVAGFSPAAEPRPVQAGGSSPGVATSAGQAAAAAGESSGEDEKDAKAKALAAALVEAAAKEPRAAAAAGGAGVRAEGFGRTADVAITDDGAFETMNVDLGGDRIVKAAGACSEDGGRDLYEFFLDQNLMIVAWKDSPKKEDAVVFVRDEVPR
ncbi:unnamed protein product [Scytosiphon promiscuus]